jgi:hypothetical protein
MKQKYGLPYQGGKSSVAEMIVDKLPPAENFVDLFFGGGSITHAAMHSGKYKNFIANDLRQTPQMWNKACDGIGTEYDRFVSREEFLRSDDPIIKYIWSFGCSMNSYCAKDLNELIAKLVTSDDLEERYTAWRQVAKRLETYDGPIYKSLHPISSVTRLRAMKRLKGEHKVFTSNESYVDVEIPDNSVVYADPPYAGTGGYGQMFDSEVFWQWCRTRNFQVWISEMSAPDDFAPVLEYSKQAKFNKQSGTRKEYLFLHKKWI